MRKYLSVVVACLLLAAGLSPILAQDIPASSQIASSTEEQVSETEFLVMPDDDSSIGEDDDGEKFETLPIHPIDREVNKRFAKTCKTSEQVAAVGHGLDLWDAEMNRFYNELMQGYGDNKKAKAKLKASQRAWIKFRDAEYEHLGELYAFQEGTMLRSLYVEDKLEITKARAIELKSSLAILTGLR